MRSLLVIVATLALASASSDAFAETHTYQSGVNCVPGDENTSSSWKYLFNLSGSNGGGGIANLDTVNPLTVLCPLDYHLNNGVTVATAWNFGPGQLFPNVYVTYYDRNPSASNGSFDCALFTVSDTGANSSYGQRFSCSGNVGCTTPTPAYTSAFGGYNSVTWKTAIASPNNQFLLKCTIPPAIGTDNSVLRNYFFFTNQ